MPLLIGGELNRRTDNFGGPVSRLALESLTFDTAFFSAYGLHPEFGLSDPEQDDAEIKRLVCKRSRRQAIAVSHDKLGLSAAGAWMPNTKNSILATDLNPDDQRLLAFQSLFQSIL
jgi:DeoR/GlpR family transcriptional regulator of sugar metabolism